MNGGMIKAAGHGAIAALAGLLLSTSSALAADLGGNCCADLEERIAELEATTARKGNRKMSLTITGQVNKVIQYWNDGHTTGAFYGLDNTNSSSRFSFLGEARVSPKTKVGFEIMLETEGRIPAAARSRPTRTVASLAPPTCLRRLRWRTARPTRATATRSSAMRVVPRCGSSTANSAVDSRPL